MADYKISAILSLRDELTSKLKNATGALKNIGKATANVERGMGSVSKGISSVTKGIGDFHDQNLKLRLNLEGLERVERLRSAIEAARAGKPINIRANDEATSRLQKIKSELQSLVSKPWTALVNIKDNAKAALGKMKTGVSEMVGGAAMGMGATMLGTAGIGYGAVNAIQSQMNFEKQMSAVRAIYSGSYDGKDLDSVMATLTEAAERAGATTRFTAKEAADAEYFLAMAGWKPEQAAAGLMPTVNLAAAGNAELGLTADILSDSMTGFQLKAGQYITNSQGKKVEASAYYADLMGALVTHANTDIPMLGETLKYASSIIGAMYADQSAEAKLLGAQDTMLLAGTMANAGIKSSQAGTTIRSLFARTGSQNRNAFFAMEEALGIKTADEHGNVRRIKDVFADLRKAFNEGMDVDKLLDFEEFLSETKIHADTRRKLEGFLKGAQANGGKITGNDKMKLAAMINGQEGMSGFLAAVLSADWDNIDDALDHAEGTVDKMAAIQRDNLAGSITIMGSAWDAFQRNLVKGDASKGLRAFVDSVTDTLNKANELFKDGIDIGDFGTIIIDVIAKLKAKFLELDGIGSILAGGALIMGMKKILSMALNVKDTLSAWSKVRSAGDVGGMIRGGKGAGAGGLSSVGAMSVRAGSVSIRAAVVNVSGAVRGLNGGNGGAGGRGGAVSVNQQRVNDYYNRRQQILNPTRPTTVPPVVPPSATPPPAAPPAATGKVASVLKGGLKAGGGAGALAAVFGVMDVMAARSQGEYALQTAQSELEFERGQLKILREQEADVTQLNDQVAKIRALEAKVSQTQELNSANERRAIGGAGGMIAGTMAGAALGSIVPVVGTAIGGLIGGIVGGILGQSAGEAAADKYTEFDNARREGIAKSQGVGGTGEASMGDFRRMQDEGYSSIEALRDNAAHISSRQSAEYDGLRAAAERKRTEQEQAAARRTKYEQADAEERGRMDWQSFKQLEDETYEARRSAKSKREESAEAIRDQFDAEKTRQEEFGRYTKVDKSASGYDTITPGMKISRQEAAGYTSLNGVDTGATGLEDFGVMKTAEQVRAEVEERKRVTELLDEFDANGERRKAVEAARSSEGGITPTDPYAGLKQTGVGNYSAEQTPVKMLKGGSLVDVMQAGKPPEEANEPATAVSPYDGLSKFGMQKTGLETKGAVKVDTSKLTPTNPLEGLSKYGGQKTGLENYGVKQGESADGKPFSLGDFLDDLLFNKAAASPLEEAAETGVGGMPEVNASENINRTLDGLESVKSKVGEVNETLSTGLESAKSATAETFDGIGEKISAGLESTSTTFDSFKNAASSKFDELSSSASEKFSGIGEKISAGLASANETFDSFKTTASSSFDEITTSVGEKLSSVRDSVTSGITEIGASVSSGAETFATSFSAGFEALTTGVASTFEAIAMTASMGLESLQMTASSMLEGVSMSFSATFESILATTSATFESLSATISASVSAASAVITSTFSSAAATVQGIWGAIPGFFSGVFGSLGGIAAGAGSAIASGINSGIGMIMGAWESLSGWLSAKISSLASMAANAAASIGIGSNASGTSSWRGGFTTVNEHGGELIILPNGKTITPFATMQDVIAHNYSGTSFFEGGWSEVNGTGSELMFLPRGTKIIPHAATVGILRKQFREKMKEQSHENFLQQSEWQSAAAPAVVLKNGRPPRAWEYETAGVAEENRRLRDLHGMGERRTPADNNAAPAITRYLRNKELFTSSLRGAEIPEYNRVTAEDSLAVRRAYLEKSTKQATRNVAADSLGNLLNVNIPDYNRVTADDSIAVRRAKIEAQRRSLNIAHNYGGTSNFEGGFTTVNEHGGEIIQLPNGKAIYPMTTVERELKTDRLGNIRGLDAPSYNRITGGDSLTVRNAKYQAQLKQWKNQPTQNLTSETVTSVVDTGKTSHKNIGGKVDAKTVSTGDKNFFEKGFEATNDFFFRLFHPRKYAQKKAGVEGVKTASVKVDAPDKKSGFQRSLDSFNDFFFKIFHPRKYAQKKAAAQNAGIGDTKAVAANLNAPDKKTPLQSAADSVNDFFFKIFHPRKYAAKKARQREDIFQQTVNERAATLNAASDTNVADAVNSTTKQVAGVDWGGVLKLLLGKNLNRSSVNLGTSEYAERRRAAQANWVANLQRLNPTAPVRTFGMANALLNPLIRIQSAGLPTSGSNSGSINDFFFKIFHPRKYAAKQNPFNKDVKTATISVDETDKRSAIQRTFNSVNDFFFKIFHPRKYAAKKRGSDELGNINGLNGLPDNVITETDSLAVQKAKREAQIRAFKSQHTEQTGQRKNFFEKTWEAFLGFFGGGKKKSAELKPIVNAAPTDKINPTAPNPVGEVSGSAVADAKKSADIFQNELPPQARSLDPNRKTQAEILYEELSAQYAELERLGMVSKPSSATNTVAAPQTRVLSSTGMTLEQLQELRRENVNRQVAERYASIGADNLETYRAPNARDSQMRQDAVRKQLAERNLNAAVKPDAADFRAKLEKNARDSEALAKIRRESVRKRLAGRDFTVSEESLQTVRELNAAAIARSSNNVPEIRRESGLEHRNTGSSELEKIANDASAKLEKNRRDSEALAKIRRESVKKRLAERNFTVSEESLQVVRDLNEAAVARSSHSSTPMADIHAENLHEIQRLRETGGLDAGELPVPKLTVPTSEGGTTNSTTNTTSNNSSVNMNFGDVNINNGADFEEFMHRLKTLFTQSAVNFAGA